MELFKLDDDYLVDINKEWITTIKEFRKLFTRDNGRMVNSKEEGKKWDRRRDKCRKELTFIYHYVDFRSPFIEYEENERLIKAAENAEMDIKDIEKDEDLQLAIAKYRELQETRSLKLVNSGYKALDLIRKTLDRYGNADGADVETAINVGKLINDLPKNIKTLKELDAQVKAELSDKQELRGGSEKGFDEDPE